MKPFVIAFALALGLATIGYAQTSSPSQIQVLSPWARATPGGAKNGAAYMTIVNKGKTDDRLVAISTPIAAKAEMHRTESKNGVMAMLPVPSLEVKGGHRAVFRPAGYHVMLVGLTAALVDGQSFPMTLAFEKAGSIEITVKVQKAAPKGHGDMGGMEME